MERIYLAYSKKTTKDGFVKVKIFLKDVSVEHIASLKSFLGHQRINVSDFRPNMRKKMPELAYFDDGFNIKFVASRWSYFRLRSYIHTYLDSWADIASFCCRYLEAYSLSDKAQFDDHFFVKLGELVDGWEDQYYFNNRSIAIFITGILQIFRDSLSLYWASASLKNTASDKLDYINYTPASFKKQTILNAHKQVELQTPPVLHFPVMFNNDHIADFHVQLGAYSPPKAVVRQFVGFVLMHIDDFIYGDLLARKERFYLQSRITELEKRCGTSEPHPLDITPTEKRATRLLLLGATELEKNVIELEFKKAGFDIDNVDFFLDYDKMKNFDINKLKRIKSKYDAILLGPMPHKMFGDMPKGSLIDMMNHTPSDYPSFVVIRTKAQKLAITKSSLSAALQKIATLIELQDRYEI